MPNPFNTVKSNCYFTESRYSGFFGMLHCQYGIQEVVGSIPSSSTTNFKGLGTKFLTPFLFPEGPQKLAGCQLFPWPAFHPPGWPLIA